PSKLYNDFFGSDESRDNVPSRVVMIPGNGLKPSLDLDKHGIFTQVLLDGLRGKADVEGYEADGNITANELIKYFRKHLPELADQQLADKKIDLEAFLAKRTEIQEETKLSDVDARQFAATVLRGAKLVRDGFFKDVNQGTMIDHAIDGMYKAINEKIPPSLKE